MAQQATRIVLLPRYTSLVGPSGVSGNTDFLTPPVNVRAFASADIVGWLGLNPGDAPTFTLQQSPDLVTWSDLDTVDADSSQPVTVFEDLRTEWVRLKGTVPHGARFSCWVVGEFTLRSA